MGKRGEGLIGLILMTVFGMPLVVGAAELPPGSRRSRRCVR